MIRSGVSVIMPHYNHGAFVGEALRALVEQPLPPDEIVVVDDGSRPEEREALVQAAAGLPTVRLELLDENRGPLAAVNRGLELASGEFLYFASADDRVRPALFASLVPALQAHHGIALASGLAALIDGAGQPLGTVPVPVPSESPALLAPAAVGARLARSGPWLIGNATVYRAALLREAGGFPPCGAYTDLVLAMILAARHGAFFTPALLADWRVADAGYASSMRNDFVRGYETLEEARAVLEASAEAFPPGFIDRWRADQLRKHLLHHLRRSMDAVTPRGGMRLAEPLVRAAVSALGLVLLLRTWGVRGTADLVRARRTRRG
ncbi:MAG: glycosyltransferase family A protein [Dehalococcoidia bacterium]